MKSADLSDFEGNADFDSAFKSAPEGPGVYFLRLKSGKTFPRINGETDIVYIGSSKNLKRRFNQYCNPGSTQWTNRKVKRFVKEYGHDSEFFWKKTSSDRIKIEEHNLLRRFEQEHHEKPPLNGADSRNLKLEFKEDLHIVDNGIITKKI